MMGGIGTADPSYHVSTIMSRNRRSGKHVATTAQVTRGRGKLAESFAARRPVTILIRDVLRDEYLRISNFAAFCDCRSAIIISQTMTILF